MSGCNTDLIINCKYMSIKLPFLFCALEFESPGSDHFEMSHAPFFSVPNSDAHHFTAELTDYSVLLPLLPTHLLTFS